MLIKQIQIERISPNGDRRSLKTQFREPASPARKEGTWMNAMYSAFSRGMWEDLEVGVGVGNPGSHVAHCLAKHFLNLEKP
jgi:hypothetical protein